VHPVGCTFFVSSGGGTFDAERLEYVYALR
jgi:hypothetical protein